MKLKPEDIPEDFVVRPLRADENPPGKTTCGACGLSWRDYVPTQWTPAPSARCPFEYFHHAEAKGEARPFSYWLLALESRNNPEWVFALGQWGPKYIVQTDDEDNMQELVAALNQYHNINYTIEEWNEANG